MATDKINESWKNFKIFVLTEDVMIQINKQG